MMRIERIVKCLTKGDMVVLRSKFIPALPLMADTVRKIAIGHALLVHEGLREISYCPDDETKRGMPSIGKSGIKGMAWKGCV